MTTDEAPRLRRRTFRPGLDHKTSMRVARTEYARVVSTLERLGATDWERPTDCPGWDVRAVAGHTLGMGRLASSLAQMARQLALAERRAKRDGVASIDALTALQVEEQAGLDPAALIDRMREVAPRAVRGRSRVPGALRRRVLMAEETEGVPERWSLDFLQDTILTRDPFMHRLDIARATGVLVPPTADHEGVIVSDVVAEWASRHGQPFALELTGGAGGRWVVGDGGERITMDALDFCRVLSGRGEGAGLLARQVPF